jgi:hypothetical protein
LRMRANSSISARFILSTLVGLRITQHYTVAKVLPPVRPKQPVPRH